MKHSRLKKLLYDKVYITISDLWLHLVPMNRMPDFFVVDVVMFYFGSTLPSSYSFMFLNFFLSQVKIFLNIYCQSCSMKANTYKSNEWFLLFKVWNLKLHFATRDKWNRALFWQMICALMFWSMGSWISVGKKLLLDFINVFKMQL